MKAMQWVIFALVAALAVSSARGQDSEGNPPKQFDTYWMVFLERGDHPPELDDAASMELQRKHLAHLSKIKKEGYSLVAGPFEVPENEPLRGIVLYRGDLDSAAVVELASADPAVKAGRLKVRVMRWWTPGDALCFPASAAKE